MTEDHSMSRRKALAGIGSTMAVTATAGCVGQIKRTTGLGQTKLDKELETVRKATEKYNGSPKKAYEDGYTIIQGPYIPGMGWHFSNPKYLQSVVKNGFDLEKPPILYFNNEGEIGGVEYGGPVEKISNNPNLFSTQNNGNVEEDWTVHKAATHIMANGNGEVDNPQDMSLDELLNPSAWTEFHPPKQDLEVGDTYKADYGQTGEEEERVLDIVGHHPSIAAVHVWVHQDNPEGVFNPINPNFAQD